jgi:molybdopterin/thiamine biosynthesis adenylyltransferase
MSDTNSISYNRQLSVFKPQLFKKTVDIIGVGATGSHLAYILAKMGIETIRAYDFDKIEEHNIPNQLYRLRDVGRPKVEALQELVKELTEIDIETFDMKIEKGCDYKPGNIVFLLTDTMHSRKEIFEEFLKLRFGIEQVIETRMSADSGRIYSFCPTRIDENEAWEATLYKDDEAEESLCGTSISIAATAVNIASAAAWQLIKHDNGEMVEKEIIYGLKPFMSMCS